MEGGGKRGIRSFYRAGRSSGSGVSLRSILKNFFEKLYEACGERFIADQYSYPTMYPGVFSQVMLQNFQVEALTYKRQEGHQEAELPSGTSDLQPGCSQNCYIGFRPHFTGFFLILLSLSHCGSAVGLDMALTTFLINLFTEQEILSHL